MKDVPTRQQNKKKACSCGVLVIFLLFWVLQVCDANELDLVAVPDWLTLEQLEKSSVLKLSVADPSQVQLVSQENGFKLQLGSGLAVGFEGCRVLDGAQKIARLESLRMCHKGRETSLQGIWEFPSGKNRLVRATMKTLEKIDPTLHQYQLEFWINPGLTVRDYQKKQRDEAIRALNVKDQSIPPTPLNAVGQAEVFVSNVFCQVPYSDENFSKLHLTPVHQSISVEEVFGRLDLDANYHFYRPLKNTVEAKFINTIIKLYKLNKYALSILATDFFLNHFKHSEFKAEVQFMKASALLHIHLPDAASDVLNELIKEHPLYPEALSGMLYQAFKSFDARDYATCQSACMWLNAHYPDHQWSWMFHLLLAESLVQLRRLDEAFLEYSTLINNYPEAAEKMKVGIRIGDLLMLRHQYEQALIYYSGAGEKEKDKAINAHLLLNIAECYYQVGMYEKSRQVFERVTEQSPDFYRSWQAYFRLGLIAGATQKKTLQDPYVQGLLRKIVDHYPQTIGAEIAWMRVFACDPNHGYTFLEAQTLLNRIMVQKPRLDVQSENQYDDLKTVDKIRVALGFNRLDEAFHASVAALGEVHSEFPRQFVFSMIEATFSKMIGDALSEGKNFEALRIFLKGVDLVPKHFIASRSDLMQRLINSAQLLNLNRLAEDIVKIAKSATHQSDLLPESTAVVEQIKALWRRTRRAIAVAPEAPQTQELVAELTAKLEGFSRQSQFFPIAELIHALLSRKLKSVKQELSLVINVSILVDSAALQNWLAGCFIKANRLVEAQTVLERVQEKIAGLSSDEIHAHEMQLLQQAYGDLAVELEVFTPQPEAVAALQADLFKRRGLFLKAADIYLQAIRNNIGSAKFYYEYAQAVEQGKGSKKEARRILEKFSEDPKMSQRDAFWVRLAKEKILNEDSIKEASRQAGITKGEKP
jgi:tetratricopeptide (TPR) repeat protein